MYPQLDWSQHTHMGVSCNVCLFYLLHCSHRVSVTLHKSSHSTSLKTSRNQRLQKTRAENLKDYKHLQHYTLKTPTCYKSFWFIKILTIQTFGKIPSDNYNPAPNILKSLIFTISIIGGIKRSDSRRWSSPSGSLSPGLSSWSCKAL